jgi:hypothetical protein
MKQIFLNNSITAFCHLPRVGIGRMLQEKSREAVFSY